MTLPKMYPTPTPGPMVPSPAPTPSAMALRPLLGSAAWAKSPTTSLRTSTGVSFQSLVVRLDGAPEVDGSKRGEDEGLKRRDQDDLEGVERDRCRQGDEAEGRDAEQDGQAAGHEQDEQVAGEDVGEQSDREADDPHEVGDDLDGEDRHRGRAGDPGGDPA